MMADKGKIVKFPDRAQIEAEAAAWVARFDGGDVSAEQYADFQQWLDRSAFHREAVTEYGKFWAEFDQLRDLTGRGAANPGKVRDRVRRWGAPMGIAAAIAVVIWGGFYRYRETTPAPVMASYETAIGGQKTVTLADGTAVGLNTDSRIDVAISNQRRDVRLVRGEAFFEVAHDEKRPFTVLAGRGIIRDIGTAFAVRLQSRSVNVSVTKGSVEIAAVGAGKNQTENARRLAVVEAGRDVSFDRTIERSELLSDAEMNRRLAWREGVLIYAGEPLGKLIDDLGRYSSIEIELADPKLRNRPVGGAFKINQIHAVFGALESNFGIRADWLDAKHVRLSSVSKRSSQHAPRAN